MGTLVSSSESEGSRVSLAAEEEIAALVEAAGVELLFVSELELPEPFDTTAIKMMTTITQNHHLVNTGLTFFAPQAVQNFALGAKAAPQFLHIACFGCFFIIFLLLSNCLAIP
nr:hypothetical protein [uncultured Fournierella sp.]